MHAVVVRVTLKDVQGAEEQLRNEVVPQVSQAPGFVNGYWTRKDETGLSMILFDSEEAANSASERIPSSVPESVDLEGVEVREVVANA
jgi:hypothetical protein